MLKTTIWISLKIFENNIDFSDIAAHAEIAGRTSPPSLNCSLHHLVLEGHRSWLQAQGLVFLAAPWHLLWGGVGREGRDIGCFRDRGLLEN